jgi:hypothetical protein
MATIKHLVQRCDVGDTDAFTVGDAGASYVASVATRPFLLAGLMNRHGVRAGALLAQTVAGSFLLRLIRDFGRETKDVTVDLTSAQTVKGTLLNDCTFAELRAVQVEFLDGPTPVAWALHQFALKPRKEQSA